MRTAWLASFALIVLIIGPSASAQQTTSSGATSGPQSSQAASMLQSSIAAATGGLAIADITITGTITNTVTSNAADQTTVSPRTETGTIKLIATAAGQSQIVVTTASGARTETRDASSGTPTLNETGPDGITHSVATSSALVPHPAWFFPALVMSAGLVSPTYTSAYIGSATWNGTAVQHLSIWLLPGALSSSSTQAISSTSLQSITQHDIYLDASSFLPVAETFTMQPYSAVDPTKPPAAYLGSTFHPLEQVIFANYQKVQGCLIAFQIQTSFKTSTSSTSSDIEISSVAINTGATISTN